MTERGSVWSSDDLLLPVTKGFFLAVLVFSVVVLAAGTATAQSSGSVTVSNLDDLRSVSESPGLNYVLANDINASGVEDFEPIGDEDNPFTGTFDGNGHTITGLTVDRPDEDNVGLFGYVGSGGTVTNVGLEDTEVTGNDSVGGIVGYNEGTVRRSHATGSVRGVGSVGGLVGRNIGVVTESYSAVEVNGEENVGGLIGRNGAAGSLSESYTTGGVNGNKDVGGAVGSNGGDLVDSYARGGVEGNSTVGGLVGVNSGGTVQRSYSTGRVGGAPDSGGLVGDNNGDVVNSYWNSDTTNQGMTRAGIPLSTEEMTGVRVARNMELDFGETWEIREDDYPALAWQLPKYEPPSGSGEEQEDSSEDESDGGTEETDDEEEPDEGLPGFGVLAGVAAVLVGWLLLRKERRR